MTWHVLAGRHAAWTQARIPPAALAGVPHKRGAQTIVVKHDFPTWVQMRARGMVLPSPLAHYDWPGRFKPFEHQRKTAEFLVSHPHAFCFNGLGLGKTLSALWALDYLMQQGAVRRALIIAPLAVCRNVWEAELFKTLPRRQVSILSGTSAQKKANAARSQTEIIVVNPESLPLVASGLAGRVDCIIVDEATKFKNAQAKRWKCLHDLTTDVPYLWLMTGTPSPQSPMDAYGLLRLVRKKYISASQWRNMTMLHISRFRWVDKPDAHDTLAAWLRPAVWFRREDCVDMPETPVPIRIPVELSPEQQKLTRELTEEARALVGDDYTISAPNAAVVVSKIMQVQAGGVYATDAEGERYAHSVPAPAYYDAIEEFVEQADTGVLILTSFRASARAIAGHLEKAGYTCARVDGGVPHKDRQDAIRRMSEGALKALVAVPGTMSHGVDGLQFGARFVLWASPTYSAESYEQTIGRLVRTGQKREVVVGQIVTSPLANRLYDRLESKAKLQEAVLALLGE